MMKMPEQHRAHPGQKWIGQVKRQLWSVPGALSGCFLVPKKNTQKPKFFVVATNGTELAAAGWDHVSVTVIDEKRTPTWEEMCYIKSLFWEPEDCVVQFHPRESQYVSMHPFALHLWKNIEVQFPEPDPLFVGIKT